LFRPRECHNSTTALYLFNFLFDECQSTNSTLQTSFSKLSEKVSHKVIAFVSFRSVLSRNSKFLKFYWLLCFGLSKFRKQRHSTSPLYKLPRTEQFFLETQQQITWKMMERIVHPLTRLFLRLSNFVSFDFVFVEIHFSF
jgi:hypothetical protein